MRGRGKNPKTDCNHYILGSFACLFLCVPHFLYDKEKKLSKFEKRVIFFNRKTEENAKQNEKEKLVFVFASILGIYVCNCVLNCIYQTKRSSNQERERKFRLVRFLGKY